jgi:hypothetical protein
LDVLPLDRDEPVFIYYVGFEEFGLVLLVAASETIAELNAEQLSDLEEMVAEQNQIFRNCAVRFKNG